MLNVTLPGGGGNGKLLAGNGVAGEMAVEA